MNIHDHTATMAKPPQPSYPPRVRPLRKLDLNPRSSQQRHGARQRRARPWPRRRRPYGLALFGVMFGGILGYMLTDPTAWRELKLATGLPVAERPQLNGWPTRITDGDTFRFAATRIRLHGVDAPEMSTPDGEPAKAHLANLIATSPGPLRCEDTGDRTYERIVAQCFTADGRDLSAAMAEDGWATAMLRFSGWTYLPAQIRAVWARRGMWTW